MRNRTAHTIGLGCILIAFTGPLWAQVSDARVPGASTSLTQSTSKPHDGSFVIGNDDLLAINAKILDLFVLGTSSADLPDSKTYAKPEIWTEMDKFNAAANKMQEAVVKLNVAAKSGSLDALKPAADETAKACKACHDDFRMK